MPNPIKTLYKESHLDKEITAEELIAILSTLHPDYPVKIYYQDEDLFYNITEVWVNDNTDTIGIE